MLNMEGIFKKLICSYLNIAVVVSLIAQPARADSVDLRDSDFDKWALINAFRAAYVSWDVDRWDKQRDRHLKRDFDFDDYALDRFYVLQVDWNDELQTENLKQKLSFGLELIKNPFALSNIANERSLENNYLYNTPIISQYTNEFSSKKNNLQLYIENEIALGDRLELSFEGELDLTISDTTDISDLPAINEQEHNTFSPEVEVTYNLSESVSLYANFGYSSLPVSTTGSEVFQPQIDNEFEVGIETEFLNGKLSTSIYLNNSTQKNVTNTVLDNPFEVRVDEQKSQEIGLEIIGEIKPGWNFIIYYAYTDTRIAKDTRLPVGDRVNNVAKHSGGLWTTYEIQAGYLQGLGFGSGVRFVGDRPGNMDNSLNLPSYLQTDLAIFYHKENWKAVINIENLFNVEYFNGTPLTVLATVWVEF